MRILPGFFVLFILTASSFAQNQPRRYTPTIEDECPQGREIRAKKQYPAAMSDCQVLDEDTKLDNNRRRGDRATSRQPPAPDSAQSHQQQPQETPAQKSAKQAEYDLNLGYATITPDDFILDSKDLIKSGKKIVVEGYYRKLGSREGLYPSQAAAQAAPRIAEVAHIDLLTEEATRNLRAYFLKCSPGRDMLGCWTRVRGHAETCTLTVFGNTVPKPCLVAESGWFLND